MLIVTSSHGVNVVVVVFVVFVVVVVLILLKQVLLHKVKFMR